MKTFIAIIRLYFIHIFAFLAAGLSTYYPPWDILLALVYLLIIGMEAYSLKKHPALSKLAIILAWQGPGIVFFLLAVSKITVFDIGNYAFFIMLFWYTPLIPFLSLLPGMVWRGYPLYYYFLLSLPFVMAVYHYILSTQPNAGIRNKYF